MKLGWLRVCLCFTLTGCEQSKEHAENAPLDAKTEVIVKSHPWDIQNYGVDSAEGLLPFVTSSTLDGNTHRWIYKIDDEGKREWGLLFLRSGSKSEITYDVFRETYSGLEVTRTRLTADEVAARIDRIRNLLDQSGAIARFDYFYAGGRLPEDESMPLDEEDPFGSPRTDIDSEEVRQEIADHINKYTLWDMATAIRYYHRTIGKVKQDGGRKR